MTESTTRACYVPPELLQVKKGSCGKALPGVNIKIIDGDGNDLPNNKTGEILLHGPNIMKGYFGDPGLTKESLVNGWLRTGDIGYMDNDGFLYIEDRKKDIIKCAGERISPGEIEEVLMEYAGVQEAAIIGEPDMLMGEIIHAYIVPRSESLNKMELRNHCLKRLSHNKVPYHYTIIDCLPKTETGKVQKYLLTSN
ncbi:MAG: AMP-binding protein [Desulfobacteraceae bacterium]